MPPDSARAAALIALGVGITSAGHYLIPPDLLLWHSIFQRLYYLPVVYAAIQFGSRGGLATAVLCAILYIPHIVTTWATQHHYTMEQYAEIFMFLAVGLVTGVLADRERKRKAELQQTARRLADVYQELNDSFEQLKRAERLSAVGQLAAGLAHEIRNPLASIDGAAEVMQAAEHPEEVRAETMGIIRGECSRLNRLLTNLLDFARPRHPEWCQVDLPRVIDSVASLVKHSAGKNIDFVQQIDTSLPPLVADEELIAQVLLNLTINAAQAMPGGGRITLMAENKEGGVLLSVRDEGSGIDEESMHRVFDPFFTTKTSGTGLGLSVVDQITRQLGGAVDVKRNPDRGMTFSLFFPPSREENA
jgi:two-component system, NtrC family, sensor histidine kinase HydH